VPPTIANLLSSDGTNFLASTVEEPTLTIVSLTIEAIPGLAAKALFLASL
jgi:hypothetical protein